MPMTKEEIDRAMVLIMPVVRRALEHSDNFELSQDKEIFERTEDGKRIFDEKNMTITIKCIRPLKVGLSRKPSKLRLVK